MRRILNAAQIAALKEMDGCTSTEILAAFSWTGKDQMRKQCEKHGVRYTADPQALEDRAKPVARPREQPCREGEAEMLVRMHVVDKMTLSQIADKVGRTTSSVKGIVARNRGIAVALMRGQQVPLVYEPLVPADCVTSWTHPESGAVISLPRLRFLERMST